MRTSIGSVCLASLLVAGSAGAQTFPADSAWVPFRCGSRPMTDGVRDQSAAVDERDLVGDLDAPAAFRWSDQRFLYLRLRIDETPTAGTSLRPYAWGFAFSTNAALDDYEVLVTVDGGSTRVALYGNTAATLPNSPTDPADSPPVATYPFATHGRTQTAESSFGGERDHFLDMAVPWSALGPLGLTEYQTVVVWAASSTSPDRLDGDFACHDARGGSGVPDLSGSASDSTTPAGTGGAGGTGGTGGRGTLGGASLEGGPGCSAGHAAGRPSWLSTLLLALLLRCLRRRR
jgi:hypothetical protein